MSGRDCCSQALGAAEDATRSKIHYNNWMATELLHSTGSVRCSWKGAATTSTFAPSVGANGLYGRNRTMRFGSRFVTPLCQANPRAVLRILRGCYIWIALARYLRYAAENGGACGIGTAAAVSAAATILRRRANPSARPAASCAARGWQTQDRIDCTANSQ